MLFVEELCNNNNGYFVGEYNSLKKYNTFYKPHVLVNIIPTIINKGLLLELEQKYDAFLERNQQKLINQNTIEDYLDIRDAISLQIMYITRKEKIIHINNINTHYSQYLICKQLLFPLLR
jgi:ribosomal protein S1